MKVAGGVDVLRRLRVGAERIVAIERAHLQVVEMHVLAGRDVAARETDDLVVALDRRACAIARVATLCAGGTRPTTVTFSSSEARAADELGTRDDDVVVGVKADGQRSFE